MLTKLSLENFKSWRCISDMRLAPITGLFGTNSSGKSSILQWLLLMKQTVESPDRAQVLDFGDDRRGLVDPGTFQDIVRDHQSPGQIAWQISFDLPDELRVVDPNSRNKVLFKGGRIEFSCSLRGDGSSRPFVEELAYRFADHKFTCRAKGAKGKYELLSEGPSAFQLKRTQGRVWDLPAPVKSFGFPDQVSTYFQNAGFLPDLQLAFEQQFGRIFYLGPLREYPRRQYSWGGARPTDTGQRGERVLEAILAAREAGERISRGKGNKGLTLEEYVAYWLKKSGLIHSFQVRPVSEGSKLFQVHVQKHESSTEVLITDVGFGISQILPVITLCYYVPEGSTVILEQPEIHLHPAVQSCLADILIDATRVRKIQVLVESHSEHLLRRLQLRIAEESLTPQEVAMYFCEINNGESRLVPLEVDSFGNIANWPKDFFGDSFGEMAAMTKAAIRRRRGGAA